MIHEPLAGIDSPIHKLDPRIRLAACIGLSLLAALSRNPAAPALILAFGLLASLLSRPPWRYALRQGLAVNLFILFLWLFLPFTAPGDAVGQILGLPVSRAGIQLAFLITLKGNAVFLCVLALLATIPVTALGQAMTALGMPVKLAFIFVFTYRYLHVIAEEYTQMKTAAVLRGFAPATDRRTYRTYGAMVAMVLVRSHDRAQRVYQAMLLRGFQGAFPSLHRFQVRPCDILFLIIAAATGVGAVALEISARLAHG